MLRPILVGGFVAGIFDLAAGLLLGVARGGTPVRFLQTIASGFLGRAAYEGGVPAAALGNGAATTRRSYISGCWRTDS
ncbi:MAG: hypothetical protein WD771_05295 [Gemmatimonadaceae bacterium]